MATAEDRNGPVGSSGEDLNEKDQSPTPARL